MILLVLSPFTKSRSYKMGTNLANYFSTTMSIESLSFQIKSISSHFTLALITGESKLILKCISFERGNIFILHLSHPTEQNTTNKQMLQSNSRAS